MKRLALLLLLLISACRQAPDRRPVLFLGLDGADWQLLDPYLRNGVMPNLAALAKEGRTGVLATIQPPLSPLVWTTMMTGASPLEHGVLDFTRRNPETGTEEPITREERRVPAVWNLADLEGRGSAVFGMWATWPAEPVRGLMVADRFFSFTSRDRPPGIVHPLDREAWARQILDRVESETGYDDLREYLPWLDRAAYDEAVARPDPYAHPVSALRRILVETRAYDALAHSWLDKETPDLTVLYFQGTDTIGHVFAPYAPPRRPEVSEQDFERYQHVPELYFAEVDRLLGAWRKWAGEHGAMLMIASDHGFLWGDGRPENLGSAKAATAGLWHRDEGIYLLRGPGIESGERGRGRVDQVCATLLALLGLPPGQDIAGPPLPGSPDSDGKPVDYRARWKPAPIPDLPSGGEEEVAKLRALGYLGSDSGRGAGTRTPASFNNEGLLLRQAGRTDEAARAFEKAIALAPNQASALWNLSELLESRDRDRSDDLLIRAVEAGLPNSAERVLGRVRQAEPDRRLRLLDRALAVKQDEPKLWLARGQARFESKDCRPARADFETAAGLAPGERLAWNGAGLASLCLEDPAGAARAFRRSLEIDPDQPEIREVLGQLGG
ncbi:MAG: alkaline phosphatase family protein [Acidobacteriota bacterium]